MSYLYDNRPIPLVGNEIAAMSHIFAMAGSFDRVTQAAYRKVSDRLRLTAGKPQVTIDVLEAEQEISAYIIATEDLCATIAPAVLHRALDLELPATDEILNLIDEPLRAFLAPIFEESGIADRFVTGSL